MTEVSPIDAMIDHALTELLSGEDARRRGLVRAMCTRWPTAPALAVVFALTSAAARIEDNFSRATDRDALAAFTYRLVALLASDIYAVEALGQRPARANDLLHFWRRVDPYFLEL